MVVLDAGMQHLQFGQLVVVCGAQSARSHGAGDMLDDRPGDAEPIIGTGTPPNFIQDQQAARRRIVQDIGGFVHLYHEGAMATL